MKRQEFDFIVIGSGISGLAAAISAAENGLKVAVISKEPEITESNTLYAQGGIVATGMADSPALLTEDIINAGDQINSREAVALLAREGPEAVYSFLIDKIGVKFDTDDVGTLDLTMEAAHSVRRILHVKDKTGRAIETTLAEYACKCRGITFFSSHIAVDLITNTHNSTDSQERYKNTRVIGVYAYDSRESMVNIFFAPAVVLATGGLGNLFLHTSNPPGATGDGIAMAYRIGAEILNIEYIQFHPTVLYHRDVKRFLISESLRGEGARLVNRSGEYFMERYSPHQKDLAPRDEVARAIFREMERTSSDYVLLDTQSIKDINIEKRFPAIARQCQEIGVDINKERIPVVPAAHYSCGGIKVNIESMTSIPGLYATGETACTGVHGANRLASVSLLEGLYFGLRLGKKVAEKAPSLSGSLKNSIPDWVYPPVEKDFDSILILQDLLYIQTTMWNYSGIIRKQNRLRRALADLNYLSHRIEQFYKEAKISRSLVELRNSVLTATLIVQAAFANKISKGCHFVE